MIILGLGAVKSCNAQEFKGLYGHLGAGIYLDIGDHVRLQEVDGRISKDYWDSPSALFGFYGLWDLKKNRNLKVGIDHNSNWFEGPPFNSGAELDVTQFYIDYNYCLLFCK